MSSDHQTTTASSDPKSKLFNQFPIIVNPDGTVKRVSQFPSTAASPDPSSSSPVLTKDLALNPLHNTAGGNIAYHAGLRAAAVADDLLPLKIKGLVLDEPGFTGSERTESELRLANDAHLPTFVIDLIWELSLPIGADRDHEYCNPTAESESSPSWDKIRSLGCRVMVVGCDGDPMIVRHVALVEWLKKMGVEVVAHFDAGGHHARLNL
ncbi:alpha/beta-Hydrolases superfamily protein [Actinidia rufa]|uniref:Alpha/beta-Hydrolases superfamily protein n=1 Tax=Actinidia rufa TaxID=165716 RepID=A0A7J0EBG4_9ERIC|nr:alpha/beta-Hydrolases superfamily protein [Actinidia rufa]